MQLGCHCADIGRGYGGVVVRERVLLLLLVLYMCMYQSVLLVSEAHDLRGCGSCGHMHMDV